MNYNDDGTIKQITVKAGDTLPVGAEFDIPDNTPIPAGYVEVDEAEFDKIVVNNIRSKNLLPILLKNYWHCSYTVNNNTITLKPTEVGGVSFVRLMPITLPVGKYTFSFTATGNFYDAKFLDITGGSIDVTSGSDDFTFEITGGTTTFACGFYVSTSSTSNTATVTNIQIEKGETATDYEVYKSFDNTAYVLWQNPNPSNSFEGQSITLNDAIENYKYYEVIFKQATSVERYRSNGKIPVPLQTELQDGGPSFKRRLITAMSTTSMTIGGGMYYATYGSGTDTANNTIIIPYRVLGYK